MHNVELHVGPQQFDQVRDKLLTHSLPIQATLLSRRLLN